MIHALQTLRQERRRLADRWLALTRIPIAADASVAGGVLIELIQETGRQILEVETAIGVLDPAAARKAA